MDKGRTFSQSFTAMSVQNMFSKQATNEAIHDVATQDSSSNLDIETEKSPVQSRKQGSIWTIAGSALANLSDGYQQNLAPSTNVVFNHLLGKDVYTSSKQTQLSNALLVGSVIGILVFGYTSDRFSCKRGFDRHVGARGHRLANSDAYLSSPPNRQHALASDDCARCSWSRCRR